MPTFLSPKVVSTEIDRSQNIASIGTSSAAIVGSSVKGSLDIKLITSTQQFIEEYGIPTAGTYFHYSALAYLAQGNQLYAKRVVNGALYGGVKVKTASSGSNNVGFTVGTASTQFTPVSGQDNLFHIYGVNPGTWNSTVSVIIANVDAAAFTFDIQVWVTDTYGVATLAETWTVSRKAAQLDGFGRAQYLETVINGYSSYIVVGNDTVLYPETVLPKPNATAVALAGGSDGSAVTPTQVAAGWNTFVNQDEYDVRILINGGWADAVSQGAMKSVAETRVDCVAIMDIPYTSVNTVANMLTYRSTTQNFNSSYCAIYGPWLKVSDSYNNKIVEVPVSGYAAGRYAYNDSVGQPWTAPAGFDRGLMPGDVVALSFGADTTGKKAFTSGELDSLYSVGINPIQRKSGFGIVAWGQKTQQTLSSALQFLNVRRSLIVMEKSIAIQLNGFMFRNNNDTTRFQITSIINEYLGKLASQGAFQQEDGDNGYLVVCDTTNNTPAVINAGNCYVDVFVKPARAIEGIWLRTIISKSGVNLAELSAKGVVV